MDPLNDILVTLLVDYLFDMDGDTVLVPAGAVVSLSDFGRRTGVPLDANVGPYDIVAEFKAPRAAD
jgi:hypothetical protein